MAKKYRAKLKLCDCGCGSYPRGASYMPGHEIRVCNALFGHVSSLRNLREIVECYTGKIIEMKYE